MAQCKWNSFNSCNIVHDSLCFILLVGWSSLIDLTISIPTLISNGSLIAKARFLTVFIRLLWQRGTVINSSVVCFYEKGTTVRYRGNGALSVSEETVVTRWVTEVVWFICQFTPGPLIEVQMLISQMHWIACSNWDWTDIGLKMTVQILDFNL